MIVYVGSQDCCLQFVYYNQISMTFLLLFNVIVSDNYDKGCCLTDVFHYKNE